MKAVACIEDTAVALEKLPSYIDEFSALMKKYKQEACVICARRRRRTSFATDFKLKNPRRGSNCSLNNT